MTLRLNGDSSGFTEIKAPNAAGDNSITLPTSNGGANQLLQNGGTAGELQYTSAAGGVVYDSSGRLLVNTDSVGTDNFSTNSPLQVQAGSGAYALAIRNRAQNAIHKTKRTSEDITRCYMTKMRRGRDFKVTP